MPRLNSGEEVLKELTSLQIGRIVAGGGDTTLSGSLSPNASVAPVTAITSFTNGDPVAIIGDGGTELNAINGAPNVSMPLRYKSALAQSAGARFVEMVLASLGHIAPDTAVTFRGSRDLVAIVSALARTPIKYVEAGVADLSVSLDLICYNNPNLAFMFGQSETELGVGSSADPYQIAIGLASIGNQGFQCLRAGGTFVDGRNFLIDFNDVRVRVNGEVRVGGRPDQFRVPVTLGFTGLIQRIWT